MQLTAWVRAAGAAAPTPVSSRCLLEEERDGVHLVSLCYAGPDALDSEKGAGIDISLCEAPVSFMADYRHSEYWCRPAFGQALSQVPDETQGLILRLADGRFTVILPVVSAQYKCVLRGAGPGRLTARLFSWCDGLRDCNALAFAAKRAKTRLRCCASAPPRRLTRSITAAVRARRAPIRRCLSISAGAAGTRCRSA